MIVVTGTLTITRVYYKIHVYGDNAVPADASLGAKTSHGVMRARQCSYDVRDPVTPRWDMVQNGNAQPYTFRAWHSMSNVFTRPMYIVITNDYL